MESLMCYGSDHSANSDSAKSDSDEEDDSSCAEQSDAVLSIVKPNCSGNSSDKNKNTDSVIPDCSGSYGDSCDMATDTLKHNFFGIGESSDDDSTEPLEKRLKCDESQQHVMGGAIVEIPGSLFWKNISEQNISFESKKTFPEDDCRQKPMSNEQYVYTDRKESQRISHAPEAKKRSIVNGEIQYFKTIESPVNSRKNREYTNHSIKNGNRKMFYVHSKIQPWLSGRNISNRIPSKLEKQLVSQSGVINRVMWNVPSYSHLLVSASMDGSVKIWNVWSSLDPCVVTMSRHTKAVRDVVWSRCGRRLLTCSYDRTALITDVETGELLSSLSHSSFVTCGRYHPVDPNLVLTGALNVLQCWDLRTQGPYRTFTHKDHLGQVQDIMFTQDGRTFFSSGDLVSKDSADRNILAWDFGTGIILSNQIYQERYACTRLKTHPTDRDFLAQSHGSYIAVFSLTRPYKMDRSRRFEGHKNLGYNIGFDVTPDGRTVLSGSTDGKVYCYDYQTSKLARKIPTGLDMCMDVDCHPVLNSTLVCCGWNGVIQVWS
ncbi:hypothetical protein ScPMuIL_014973 [Solemya velum]